MPLAHVNKIDLYYEIHGSGKPLLLILGLGSDLSQYGRIIGPLSQRYRVITVDNRGCGRSSKPDEPYSMDLMADDLVALLNELGIASTHVIGISMGGRVAMSLVLRYPERVDHLALVCTGANRFDKFKVSLPSLLFLPLRYLPPFRRKFPQPRYAYERQRAATFDFSAASRLGEITAPTIIMHGERDQTAQFTNALQMRDLIPGSRLSAFKGGHLFYILRERSRFLHEIGGFFPQV